MLCTLLGRGEGVACALDSGEGNVGLKEAAARL